MKILEVVDFFKPSWEAGGIVRICYEISKCLAKRGHDVTVYATDGFKTRVNSPKNVPVNVDGIRTYYFKNASNLLARRNFYTPYYLFFVARKDILHYDIIHIHTYRSPMALCIAWYARRNGIPYVIQPHGSLPKIVAKQRLKKLYDIVWGNKLLRSAEGVIVLTSIEAEQAIKMGVNKNKVHIIANGIDLSQYENIPLQGEFRALYNIPSNAHVILYLGRLHPIKGVDRLIRAFEIVLKEIDNCVLIVAGPDDGSLLKLKILVKDLELCKKVIFTGPLYGRDKSTAYCDSDVYVLPSYYEAFPMTVLEAWAFKKPVIVTEDCGMKDLLRDSGLVVQQNPYDLATAMKEYLHQDSLRHLHGQNGYNKLKENLSVQKTAQNVEHLYREVVKSRDV